jgi:hypothetical protein
VQDASGRVSLAAQLHQVMRCCCCSSAQHVKDCRKWEWHGTMVWKVLFGAVCLCMHPGRMHPQHAVDSLTMHAHSSRAQSHLPKAPAEAC